MITMDQSKVFSNSSRIAVWLALLLFGFSCTSPTPVPSGSESDDRNVVTLSDATRLEFPGIGGLGIFDASLVDSGAGRIWMAYSAVENKTVGALVHRINSRLAYSDDAGTTWTDLGVVVNESLRVPILADSPATDAAWFHEVPDLLFDPFAEVGQQWILIWHQYLRVSVEDIEGTHPLFEHGWIAARSASAPDTVWSTARRLFVGNIYEEANNASPPGAPEYPLHDLYPGKQDLGDCAAFTEPSALALEDGIYVALKCAQGSQNGKIVLLRCSHALTDCTYLGDLLLDEQAGEFDPSFNGFSAPELVQLNNDVFLFATPTEGAAKLYRGCLLFRLDDLKTAALVTDETGLPQPSANYQGDMATFHGACTYSDAAPSSGIIYNQAYLDEEQQFQLFMSGIVIE